MMLMGPGRPVMNDLFSIVINSSVRMYIIGSHIGIKINFGGIKRRQIGPVGTGKGNVICPFHPAFPVPFSMHLSPILIRFHNSTSIPMFHREVHW